MAVAGCMSTTTATITTTTTIVYYEVVVKANIMLASYLICPTAFTFYCSKFLLRCKSEIDTADDDDHNDDQSRWPNKLAQINDTDLTAQVVRTTCFRKSADNCIGNNSYS